jgi:hypothetical protein
MRDSPVVFIHNDFYRIIVLLRLLIIVGAILLAADVLIHTDTTLTSTLPVASGRIPETSCQEGDCLNR